MLLWKPLDEPKSIILAFLLKSISMFNSLRSRWAIEFLLRGLFCEVFLKLVVGDFVALLMAAVIVALFLDCVVGKVDHWIVHLL